VKPAHPPDVFVVLGGPAIIGARFLFAVVGLVHVAVLRRVSVLGRLSG